MEDHNMNDTTEEKLLQEENIPGLTIRGQDHELELLQQLQEHFDNLNKNDSDSDNEENKLSTEKINLLKNDLEIETENQRKIRLGEMTPFGTVLNNDTSHSVKESGIIKYLQHQDELRIKNKNRNIKSCKVGSSNKRKIQPKTRKNIPLGSETVEECTLKSDGPLLSEQVTVDFNESSESEYVPSSFEESDDENSSPAKKSKIIDTRKRKKSNDSISDGYNSDSDTPCSSSKSSRIKVIKEMDDGDEGEFERRLKEYEKSYDTTDKLFHEVTEGSYFKIPIEIWSKLYNYQKVGVQWLWELHQQGAGGVLADEMGLGKTIQLISFLSGLYYSKLNDKHTSCLGLGPCIIVCPTTLMYQWVKEFHIWLPPKRVAILHACGSFSGRKQNLIRDIYRGKGVLITSYSTMVQRSDEILRYGWHYAILDEGHKIRNPDAKVTLAVKQLKTPHRLILSGSPLQNNLEELWSLFDFVFPGKLGSLPMFQTQFAIPITHGGYANASDTEVTIAYKCATVLKDLISPYLLRRTKTDVKSHIKLPEKNEQVLFCQLTDYQKEIYKSYIDSGEVHQILEGQSQIFVGIINLRKICNHPDLFTGGPKLLVDEKEDELKKEDKFGHWEKSGKMIVLKTLLRIWHKQNHRVLLFTQSRQMLNILEIFLKSCDYSYLKMDGGTCIGSRQPLINKFNNDSSYFIMLLTTKVGGLGVNLTGANRIVIFDPDWNPATDTQARERAWRIGQTQDVTVYRLISVGTIEEKMYHRQIFKQFLTNKVLKDPKQRRFFKSNDLFELFTLKESNVEGSTETGAIFAGTGSEINRKILELKEKRKKKKQMKERRIEKSVQFSASKIEKMKQIAQRISQKLGQQTDEQKLNHKNENIERNKDENGNDQNDPLPSCSYSTTEVADSDKSLTKSSKKKHKKFYFEGEHVPYLVKSKKAKVKVDTSTEEVKAVEDEYVLKKLFSKAGIYSALQHDTIMEGGPPDYAIVEKEAERIAQKAIEELKRSQEQCFPARTGIPNWTGKNGIRAKTKTDTKVLSSSQILDKIRKRNGENDATSAEIQILKDLTKFISSEGGTVSTDRLIQTFQKNLPPSVTPLFKTMLNSVCTFYRGPDGIGYWNLKNEFLNSSDMNR